MNDDAIFFWATYLLGVAVGTAIGGCLALVIPRIV